MVGSEVTHHVMGDDHHEGVEPPSPVSCSICLDSVSDNRDRSRAKLQCGHEFHLDCIGSAFNMKGAMQCPNCRKVEKGNWLYGNGSSRSFPEFSTDDWIPDEDPYESSLHEMPIRVQWCPFRGVTQIHSSFEDFREVDSPSTTYHELQGHHSIFDHDLGHHSIFAEHPAASMNSYVAYFGHIPPASSNSSASVDDSMNRHWSGLSGHSDIFPAHAFPEIQYQNWGHQRPHQPGTHINGVDQSSVPPATLRTRESDPLTRSGSFPHPFLLVHGSGARAGSSFAPPIAPHHPGSNIRSHERIQVPVFHHPQQNNNLAGMPSHMIPGMRRLNGPRGLPPAAPSQSDHNNGFYVFPHPNSSGRNPHEVENPTPNHHFHALERDFLSHFPVSSFDRNSGWDGSDSGNRSSNFWQSH